MVLDGARTLGAKILVSGGSRCNVTNASIDAGDFWNAGSPFIRQVLRALPVAQTIAFFQEIGVELKEEPNGKLFPVTNKSRTVLEALLSEVRRLGIEVRTSSRVAAVAKGPSSWIVDVAGERLEAAAVVLATGGLSLPKTGSDGLGYRLAAAQGHTIVPTTPALDPLILAGDFHTPLSGTTHDAAIRVHREGSKPLTIRGSLLWTHFGISGPLALNASRFFHRGRIDGIRTTLTVSFVPDLTEEMLDIHFVEAARSRAVVKAANEIAREFSLTQALATRVVDHALGDDPPLGKLTRTQRRSLVTHLTAFPLEVIEGRGYNFAEVTSGGILLDEVNPRTMESRIAPGLYFVGEILDVDGRIGGFNFQWAWSSGKVAGRAIADRIGV